MKKKKVLAILMVCLFTLSNAAFAVQGVATADVTIVNNYVGTADTIKVVNSASTDLLVGDKIKVYKDANGAKGTLVGTSAAATLVSNTTTASISISQLSSTTKGLAGDVWVSIVRGTAEGTAFKVPFGAEPVSTTPSSVTIVNQAKDGKDSITIVGLSPKDIVKVYSENTTSAAIATSAQVAEATTTAAIQMPGDKLVDAGGSIYLTVTSSKKQESARTAFTYTAAPQVTTSSAVVIENNVDSSYKDTVKLTGLTKGDTLTIYSNADLAASHKLASAVVPSTGTDTTTAAISMASNKFGPNSTTIYYTVARKGYVTSAMGTATVPAEAKTSTTGITSAIYNFSSYDNVKDVLEVSGVTAGDKIYLYNSSTVTTGSAILVNGTAVKTGKTKATISLSKNLGTSSGSVYLGVKSVNKNICDLIKIDYNAEQ